MRKGFRSPRWRNRRGLALITVVSMVALAMVCIVAFMGQADSFSRESQEQVDAMRAELAADSAAAVALAQLKTATTQTFSDGTPKPWTSQPGAIRVHAMDGALEKLVKLYSASDMEVETLRGIENDLPDDWSGRPDEFVDLNSPLPDKSGGLAFPIVDPRSKTGDPSTSTEGFDYEAAKGAVGPDAGADSQRLPMPVRWIYLLRDGTLTTMDEGGRLAAAGIASKSNPIVSRFAFWVDDESCKINVNTAAEGAFTDVPRADTKQERALALHQPTRREYHRQPGHPAGVCLSSVLLPGHRFHPAELGSESTLAGQTMKSMSTDDVRGLWRLGRLAVAEFEESTTLGGTRAADWTSLWASQQSPLVRQPPFATVHELVRDTSNPNDFPTSWGESSNNATFRQHAFFDRHPEAIKRLARAGFFFTKESAAPEITLHGTPRVALWPVHAQTLDNKTSLGDSATSRDTVYNHKIALVSTIKDRPWFVVRSEAGNGGNDFEAHAGGANKKLFDFLKRLTDRPVPGFAKGAASFASKYGDDRDAILLEMLDYIRATGFADGQLQDKMQFSILCPGVEHEGFGQISPLQQRVTGSKAATSNHAQGFGRALTVSEVALVVTCRAQVDEQKKIKGSPTTANRAKLKNPGDREIEVALIAETFLPGQSWADYRPYASLSLVGGAPGAAPDLKATLPKVKLLGTELTPASNGNVMQSSELPPKGWGGSGGTLGVRSLSKGGIVFKPIVVSADAKTGELPKLRFEGASSDANQWKLTVYDSPGAASGGTSSAGDLLQVIPLVFPDIDESAALPLPGLPEDLTTYPMANRIETSGTTGSPLISKTDIVQSLVPLHGDYRLTATQRWAESRSGSVTTPTFVPHPSFGTRAQAHSLIDSTLSSGSHETITKHGYFSSLTGSPDKVPDYPPTNSPESTPTVRLWQNAQWRSLPYETAVNALRLDQGKRGSALPDATGDFDNGTARTPDGPYVNRADDGHWAALKQPGKVPYFDTIAQTGKTVPPVTAAGFSGQGLLPSPVMFGSLPTGTRSHVPWQTLLFRPHKDHHGAASPPDHALLDLFWSPVVEPYAVSKPFETAGKINLNHPMLPFRHITRATAIHAAMKAEMITAIPDSAAATYKTGAQPDDRFRHYIDAAGTLGLWKQNLFDQDKVFLTAGQLCEQYLVPEGESSLPKTVTTQAMEDYWKTHRLTGDNSKEAPYARLYSRFTTRSNTFRVHFIAQSLRKARSTAADTFEAGRDHIGATVRGSRVITRTLDAADPRVPDYLDSSATNSSTPTLDSLYSWTVGAAQ